MNDSKNMNDFSASRRPVLSLISFVFFVPFVFNLSVIP
jgi:hypothetical protein